jgi:hypothetical protein
MKRAILSTLVVLAAASAAFANVTKEDLKKLVAAGVGDDVILAYVRTNGPVDNLSADDIVDLKKAGASDKLLAAVVTGRTEPAPTTQPAPQPAPEQPRQRTQEEIYRALNDYTPPASQQQPIVIDRTVYVQQPSYVQQPVYSYPSTYYAPSVYLGYYSSSRHCYPRYYSSYWRPSLGFSWSWGRRCHGSRWSVGIGW